MSLTDFLKSIADAIRNKTNTTEEIPASEFATRIEAIETGMDTSDATAAEEHIQAGKTAYAANTKIIGTLAPAPGDIKTEVTIAGVEGTFTADGDIVAGEVLSGKIGYAKGSKVIGTMTNNGTISESFTPSTSSQSYTIPAGYHDGNGTITVAAAPTSLINGTATTADVLKGKTFFSDSYIAKTGTIETKTDSDLKVSGATVTVSAGYYASQATKSVTTATKAKPTATIDPTTGKITPKYTQTEGYVTGGTVTGDVVSLNTQSATTITPGTSSKTAVAAGKYTTGAVTVAGDSKLIPANIKSGVKIFEVNGTYTGSSTFTTETFTSDMFYYTYLNGSNHLTIEFPVNASKIVSFVASGYDSEGDSVKLCGIRNGDSIVGYMGTLRMTFEIDGYELICNATTAFEAYSGTSSTTLRNHIYTYMS